MGVISFSLPVLLLIGACTFEAVYAITDRCFPGMSCFPHIDDAAVFGKSLDGPVLYPYMPEYDALVIQRNTRQTKFPYMIVVALSTDDVINAVRFARKFNMKIVVKSSGHDYEGRSTWDGAMQIYLGNMTNVDVKNVTSRSQYGEAVIESGAQWFNVYQTVDRYNRVIVGGSAHTVSQGGYTQGGGHSPVSRMFGLAVDNLLEVEMVTVNGSLIIANALETRFIHDDGSVTTDNNTDIFWAIRGGGGGTWGIITKFTFKLHPDAPQFVNFMCDFKLQLPNGTMVANGTMHKVLGLIQNKLPRQWGGYFIVNADGGKPDGSRGSIFLFFNHYGSWNTDTRRVMDEVYNYRKDLQRFCVYVNRSSFLDYEKEAKDAPYFSSYVTNILVPDFTDDFIQTLTSVIMTDIRNGETPGMTGTLLGGKVMEVGEHETAVHPGFRHAYMSLTTGFGDQGYGLFDHYFHDEGVKLNNRMRKFGNGMYRNEAFGDSPVWKDDFWGSNYPRLERIKRQWDPDNVLTCLDCVGKDL